jgi:aminoglycoside/choline kinase family phosphotransferase
LDTLQPGVRARTKRVRIGTVERDRISNEAEAVLARGLRDYFAKPVCIREIKSEPLDTCGTHLLSRLRLTLDSGKQLTVILKRLQPQPDRGAHQTVRIYRRLLTDRRLDAPAVYASICDGVRSRHWLFLEDVGDCKLHYCEGDAWLAAFRLLGRVHAAYYHHEKELRALNSLGEHSPLFYRLLARSASEVLQRNAGRAQIARFERAMARWFDAAVADLSRQPRTLVHGDAYDKNFMVQSGPRIRPLDWEYAAIGVAASDVAQLVAGWGPEKQAFITAYLDEFAKHANVAVDRQAFERTLDHCEIIRVLQVLYWWEGPYHNLEVVDAELDELETACYRLERKERGR